MINHFDPYVRAVPEVRKQAKYRWRLYDLKKGTTSQARYLEVFDHMEIPCHRNKIRKYISKTSGRIVMSQIGEWLTVREIRRKKLKELNATGCESWNALGRY
jgi:hypothetical protein